MDAGSPACELLDAELALDRLDAALAAELPAHVRAFARAHADGRPPPAVPPAARRLETARRALAHPELVDRSLPIVRLLAPVEIDADDDVRAALGASDRDWHALATLTRARDRAATALFGVRHVELVHRLHGATTPAPTEATLPPHVPGWLDGSAPPMDIDERWRELAARHGARGTLQIIRARDARPRAFVVEPGREVVIVVPQQVATPAARFAILHELGHALAALLVARPLPRVVDEAAAAYVGRLAEQGDPLAAPARVRRAQVAAVLDRVERALPAIGEMPTPRPPWALWHDAGAQAAYVAAEAIAERWWRSLGPAPAQGAFATAIRAACDDVDRATRLR